MSQAVMRCKMRVNFTKRVMSAEGTIESEEIDLIAVYGKEGTENAEWSRWTPAAHFTATISNPKAFGAMSKGYEYYVDFVPVQEAVATS